MRPSGSSTLYAESAPVQRPAVSPYSPKRSRQLRVDASREMAAQVGAAAADSGTDDATRATAPTADASAIRPDRV